MTLEKKFIDSCIKKESFLSIYLINGIQLQGTIISNDSKNICLKKDDVNEQLIYKSAISTILPIDKKKSNCLKTNVNFNKNNRGNFYDKSTNIRVN